MNPVLNKIITITPQIFKITNKTLLTFKECKYQKIEYSFLQIPKSNTFAYDGIHLFYLPRPYYTINGVTDWNTFGLLKDYKKKRQTQRDFEEELGQMETQIRDILSEITLELSEFYKDKTLPKNITITVDVVKREATMTIDGVEQERFTLLPFETEKPTDSNASKVGGIGKVRTVARSGAKLSTLGRTSKLSIARGKYPMIAFNSKDIKDIVF